MYDILTKILCIGLTFGAVSGPMGCVMIWQRITFCSDAVSHIILLAASIAMITGTSSIGAMLFCASIIGIFVWQYNERPEALLAAISSTAVSIALLLLSYLPQSNLHSLLSGDMLNITHMQAVVFTMLNTFALSAMIFLWKKIVHITIVPRTAGIEGVSRYIQLCFLQLLMFTIVIGIKIAGALMITAMLVVPPLAVSRYSASPESMAIKSALINICGVIVGVVISFYSCVPVGVAIVLSIVSVSIVLSMCVLVLKIFH